MLSTCSQSLPLKFKFNTISGCPTSEKHYFTEIIYFNKKKSNTHYISVSSNAKCVSNLNTFTNTAPKIQVNGEGGDTLVIYSHNSNGSPGDFAEEWALEWPPLFTVLIYLTQRKKTLRKEVIKQLSTCMEGRKVNKR